MRRALTLAISQKNKRKISFDEIVEVMYRTGKDINGNTKKRQPADLPSYIFPAEIRIMFAAYALLKDL